MGARIPTKFGSTRVMPDPIRIAQLTTAAVQLGQGIGIIGIFGDIRVGPEKKKFSIITQLFFRPCRNGTLVSKQQFECE